MSDTGKSAFSRPFKIEDLRDKAADVDVTADAGECAALAAETGIPAIHALSARFHIAPARQGRVDVSGRIRARLTQVCVVTLDEFETELEEDIAVTFAPEAEAGRAAERHAARPEEDGDASSEEPPDAIVDGRIDLGAIAVEFFVLGLDPYPRKPGVEFEVETARTPESRDESPFAALGRLKPPHKG
jgi:hypothetical protein